MASGDKKFSTKGRQAKKSERRLCPIGMQELKLKTDRAEVKQAKSGRSRISGIAFEALNTGGDSGKNCWVYHDFNLGLEEGSDGVVMVDRANQLVGFARAAGTDIGDVDVVKITATPDPINDPNTTQTEKALNAVQVLKWIKSMDGTIVKGQVRHETRSGQNAQLDDNGQPLRDARIAYFEAAAEVDEDEDDETDEDEEGDEEGEESDEEGDEDEGDEDEDEGDEDSDEDEEEKPAPKKAKKGDKKKGKK